MPLYRYYPIPGDRMGFLWCATQISGLGILEFGPMGTTNFATRHMGENAPIYSTHINDHILTFGDTANLRAAIREMDLSGRFEAIAVAVSSSTAIIGFDVESFCEEEQDKVKARLIPIAFSALGTDYTVGLTRAMELFFKTYVEACLQKPRSYNILGCCADEYLIENDIKELQRTLSEMFDYHCRMSYPLNTSLREIRFAAEAEFNIVLRQEALPAAIWMKERFNIPYVFSDCYGIQEMKKLLKEVSEVIRVSPRCAQLDSVNALSAHDKEKHVLILGNQNSANGLLRCLTEELEMHNVYAMAFSTTTHNKSIQPYKEEILEKQMRDTGPDILIGNSILFDFPGHAPSIDIPLLKPAGIAMKTPRPHYPLRGISGYNQLTLMLEGKGKGNVLFGE